MGGISAGKGGFYSTATSNPPAWAPTVPYTGSNPRYAPDGAEQFSYSFGFQAPPPRRAAPSEDYYSPRQYSSSNSGCDPIDIAIAVGFGSLLF